jgi:hypothetical protein
MKLTYTNAMDADLQITTEEEVATLLFEEVPELDEEDCQWLSQQLVVLVTRRVAPHCVLEVVEERS